MKVQSLYFIAPRQVTVLEEPLPPLLPDQLLIQTLLSAISPGTELLVYRGEFPRNVPVDETIDALAGEFSYPLKYGYSTVGRVSAAGAAADPAWLGRTVFAFQPHASHFAAAPADLIPVPQDLPVEEAVFLPNMETAVNFLMDGAPLIGEQVAVLGQGIVGLLTTALLAEFPLASLVTLDRWPLRRQASLSSGASASLDPGSPGAIVQARAALGGSHPEAGADLVYELSGSPTALDLALELAGFDSRIVIGSWYGDKRASIDLGGRFHRSRIRLVSSQVSSLAPAHGGRWDKPRRFQVAWEMLRKIKPSRFITHRFPVGQAGEAYRLLDEDPAEAIQVVFTY
ncbi:MAG TPA: zinc-binding alcohol dehydrogenase [Anaerolineales bacterium]